ncbi:MAG: EAL domain-containing protein [Chloroflexaceae bacterium]|nr:EAL domain-containing protein [Chloroflexaceae bacterium]
MTTFANPAALQMVGYTLEELQGQSLYQLFNPTCVCEKQNAAACCAICHTLHRGEIHQITDEVFWRQDGTSFPVEYISTPIMEQGQIAGAVVLFRDVTEHKAAEEQLWYQAFYDSLTGLPNRTWFLKRLEQMMAHDEYDQNDHQFAVLFLDLAHFRLINDSLGHVAGDELLRIVARRIEACLRPGHLLARFSGDEFMILMDPIHDITDATTLAQTIQQVLAIPVALYDYHVHTTADIGIAFNSTAYVEPNDILRDADSALQQAKAQGNNACVVFDKAMRQKALERLHIEVALRYALEHDELCVYYQPIIDLATGHIAGFEALARWQHPQSGLIFPSVFIPVAEETGLIVALDYWVLRKACEQICVWQTLFPQTQPLTVNVNMSVKTLMQRDVLTQIERTLRETGLTPASLKLEITENVMMDQNDETMATLQHLSDIGVHLCIDDFGTGFSSLRYLHRFPIQTLKIDRAFVSTVTSDDESSAITQSIAALSHTLGKQVVAEGIETTAQLVYLRQVQCDYGQGYLFSMPVNSTVATALLEGQNTAKRQQQR